MTEGQYSSPVTVTGAPKSIIAIIGLGQMDTGPNSSLLGLELPSRFVSAIWDWTVDIIDPPDFSTITDVEISGLNRGLTQSTDVLTRGLITMIVSRVVNDVTVCLYDKTSSLIAEGTATMNGPTVLTLAESNSSGVQGTMTVADNLFPTSTFPIEARWPDAMYVYRNSQIVAKVGFDGGTSGRWIEPAALDAGLYHYTLAAMSDTDELGLESTSQDITILVEPEPVENLAYLSGSTPTTILEFDPSETVGAIYNLYVRKPSALSFDTSTPVQTLPAGSTSVEVAISEYPGTVVFLIRAETDGLEEKNLNTLELEYDSAGDIVSPRQNIPEVRAVSVSSFRPAPTSTPEPSVEFKPLSGGAPVALLLVANAATFSKN